MTVNKDSEICRVESSFPSFVGINVAEDTVAIAGPEVRPEARTRETLTTSVSGSVCQYGGAIGVNTVLKG
jgi:hypothetical protein